MVLLLREKPRPSPKVNKRNDKWLCLDSFDVLRIISTNIPATVMVSGVRSNKDHVMPPPIFPRGLDFNASQYDEVLKTEIKLWMAEVRSGKPYMFLKDSTLHQKALTQEWL